VTTLVSEVLKGDSPAPTGPEGEIAALLPLWVAVTAFVATPRPAS
jgi:hypothetical protein